MFRKDYAVTSCDGFACWIGVLSAVFSYQKIPDSLVGPKVNTKLIRKLSFSWLPFIMLGGSTKRSRVEKGLNAFIQHWMGMMQHQSLKKAWASWWDSSILWATNPFLVRFESFSTGVDIIHGTLKPCQKSVSLKVRGLRVEGTVFLNGYAVKLPSHIYNYKNRLGPLYLGQIRLFFSFSADSSQ